MSVQFPVVGTSLNPSRMAKDTSGTYRKERWTVYCPLPFQEFAKKRAEQLKLRGGHSELIRRLLAAEAKSKRGIAEHQRDGGAPV